MACSGVASSNSWRLSVTSATSLAEMLVLMAPVATHGSYGTYRALTASVVRATCAGPWHSSLSMAFCVQRSPQNSSLAEEEQFRDIRPARRPRLHLVPCANMAHFSTSWVSGALVFLLRASSGLAMLGSPWNGDCLLVWCHPCPFLWCPLLFLWRRLSATSATSLAEMLAFMTPLATHGGYGTLAPSRP